MIKEHHDGIVPFFYTGKTMVHTVDNEAKRHFIFTKEPVVLDANSAKLTAKTLPKELTNKNIAKNDGKMDADLNVHPRCYYKTSCEQSAILVEACIQEILGLKHGHLWQGFGFGGISGSPGIYQVWLFSTQTF